MSQVLLSRIPLSEIDLRSPNWWLEHSWFGDVLNTTFVLVFLKAQ